ncbi:MAG: hypothetical protein ACOYJ5_03505 [Acutalibacteraceae bacterium]
MEITIPYFLRRSAKPIAALLVAAKAQVVCEKVFFALSSFWYCLLSFSIPALSFLCNPF